MAVVDIKNLEGKNVGQMDLPDAVFGAKVNPNLLHETVRWYQAAQRAENHFPWQAIRVAARYRPMD